MKHALFVVKMIGLESQKIKPTIYVSLKLAKTAQRSQETQALGLNILVRKGWENVRGGDIWSIT